MRPSFTLIAALLALAALAAATAESDGVLVGEATSAGVTITLEGRSATIGVARAAVESRPAVSFCEGRATSCAGAAVVGPPHGELAAVRSRGAEVSEQTAVFTLPRPLSERLAVNAAGANASAAGTPSPRAFGDSGGLDVAVTVESTLPGDLRRLRRLLDDLAGQAEGADRAGGLVDRVLGSLSDLVGGAADAPLLELDVGAATAEASVSDGEARAAAATPAIRLAVAPSVPGIDAADGLLVLDISAAAARAQDGPAGPFAQPQEATIIVRALNPVTGAYAERELHPGAEPDCFGAEPLRVCAQRPTAGADGEGAAQAVAGGVVITALQSPMPQLELKIGTAEAAVSRAPAQPRGLGWTAAVIGIALAAAVALALAQRRRRARAATPPTAYDPPP
ncbi:MAG TPA: hypothetical protein VML96_02265 [Egibacteraceae bacterium]|nr:hypothetical protein [Egibacteraceae bacterium]